MARTSGREEREVLAAYLLAPRPEAQRAARGDPRRVPEDRAPRLGRGPAADRPAPPRRRRPHHDLPHAEALQGRRARERAPPRRRGALRADLEARPPRPLRVRRCGEIFEFHEPRHRAPPGGDRGGDRLRDRRPPPPHLRPLPALRGARAGAVPRRLPAEARADRGPHVSLPLRFPFETSFCRTTTKEFLLVAVSADGVTGYAECVADVDPFYLPETNATVLHVLRDFPRPAGLHPRDRPPPRAAPGLRPRARPRDGEGRARDGGVRAPGRGATEPPSGGCSAAAAGRDRGRGVGGTPEGRGGAPREGRDGGGGRLSAGEDQDQARARRRAWSPRSRKRFPTLPLMVDANSAYSLADAGLFRELDAFDLTMVEQPLAWDDIVDHATLQRRDHDPGLPRRVDPLGRRRAARPRSRRLPRDQRQGRPGRAASPPPSPSTTAAARAACPSGAEACSSRASGASPTSTCRRCPASRFPATPRRARATSTRTSSIRPVVVSRDGTIAVPDGPGIGHADRVAAGRARDASGSRSWTRQSVRRP